VHVTFQKLASDMYVRKLYIACQKQDELCKLAAACRREVDGFGDERKAEDWVRENYVPHLSLLYHDCSPIEAEGLELVEKFVREAGVELAGKGELGGWSGGRVVIVPTKRPIEEWVPLAVRMI
jgi:2',3'-cyclic-nucleotide 3'-phosphodiesterase